MNPTVEELKALFLEITAESALFKDLTGRPLTDAAVDWIVPQYLSAAREQLRAAATIPERWKVLRETANDLAVLRRGDHSAARLILEREKFEEQQRRQQAEEERRKKLEARPDGLSPETLKKIEQELKLI